MGMTTKIESNGTCIFANIQFKVYVLEMRASALDLRYHTKELLDCVQSGEVVEISHRGKQVAKLVPILQTKDQGYTLPAFGMWADRKDMLDPSAFIRDLRKARF